MEKGEPVKKTEEMAFEEAMSELNRIVDKMDNGECLLSDMLTLTERGNELIRHCENLLSKYESKLTELNADGQRE